MKDQRFTIAEHIGELRRRLMFSAVAVLVCTGIAFAFHQQILLILTIILFQAIMRKKQNLHIY